LRDTALASPEGDKKIHCNSLMGKGFFPRPRRRRAMIRSRFHPYD
jgi:hypothetical protein